MGRIHGNTEIIGLDIEKEEMNMLTLILGVSLAIVIVNLIYFKCIKHEDPSEWLFGVELLCIILLFLEFLVLLDMKQKELIDEKIVMYEEENDRIEMEIKDAVENYMQYESGIYKDLKNESVMSLIYIYPELKSDVLVEKEIELYISNNDKIKELKESKLYISIAKWLLYFGD